MIRGRIPLELPAPAAVKLAKLDVARMVAEDAARAATSRLSNLPRDADPQMRDQLARERDHHAARHRALASLGHRINEWLMQLHARTVLEIAPAADNIKLRNGETWIDAIELAQNEITALQGQLRIIRAAPLPVEDQFKAAAAYVAKLAATVKPTVAVMRDDQLRLSFRDSVIGGTDDVVALLCEIFPEAVQAWLERKIEEQPARVGAMPASERLQRVAELEEKLLELERQDEALIELAAKQGIDILRRVDASPPVVLGVVIKARAQVQVQTAPAVA
jgi:hypothetical protein